MGTRDAGLFRIRAGLVQTIKAGNISGLLALDSGGVLIGTVGSGTYLWNGGILSRYAKEEHFDSVYIYGNAFVKSRTGSLWMGTGNGLHEFRAALSAG